MTRLESGPLRPQSGPADLSDIIGATLQRADKILQYHSVEIDLERGLPLLDLDMVLMEQVLFNLFDNAAKYAPQGSPITITARLENGSPSSRFSRRGHPRGGFRADLRQVLSNSRKAQSAAARDRQHL